MTEDIAANAPQLVSCTYIVLVLVQAIQHFHVKSSRGVQSEGRSLGRWQVRLADKTLWDVPWRKLDDVRNSEDVDGAFEH